MTISNAYQFIAKAIESIKRNLFINAITVGVITISFLIFATFLMLFNNINTALEVWEDDVQIEAYLSDDVKPSETARIKTEISAMTEVKTVLYIDKDKALELFKKSMGNMGSIAETLPDNPLPASFEIKLKDGFKKIEHIEAVAKKLKGIAAINDIVYGKEWVEKFSTSLALIRLIGLIIGAFLLMATIFIVSNTIRLTVYAKKEELEISKLLGATDFFIKLPFYIEGLIQGFVGSAISIASLYIIYSFFVTGIESSIGAGSFQIGFLSTPSIIYLLAGGMLLGIFGSLVSIGRFLKV